MNLARNLEASVFFFPERPALRQAGSELTYAQLSDKANRIAIKKLERKRMKALIDRSGFVSRANGGMYKNKVGATVAAFRRSGGMHAIDSMNHFLLSQEIFIVGRAIGIGRDKGEVEKDEEGMQLVRSLGRRMAWLMRRTCS